jgi:hypothetical protein
MSVSFKSRSSAARRLRHMKLDKLTTLLVVDRIEACLPAWKTLGYEVTVRAPDEGELDFVILSSNLGELMAQTKRSLAEDLPPVAARSPSALLYADVPSLSEAKEALGETEILIAERTTFYGMLEAWVVLPGGTVLGLAQKG